MTTPMISAPPLAAAPTPGTPGAVTVAAAPAAGFGAMLAAALAPAAAPRVVAPAVPTPDQPSAEQDQVAAPEPETGDAADQEPAVLDAFLVTNAVTGTVAAPAPVVPVSAPAPALAGLGEAVAPATDGVDGTAPLLGTGAPAADTATVPAVPGAPVPAVADAAGGPAAVAAPVTARATEAPVPGLVPVEDGAPAAPVEESSVLPAPVAAADEAPAPVATLARLEAPAPVTPVATVSAPAAASAVAPAAPVVPVTPAAIVEQIAPHVTSLAESGPGVHRLSLTLDPAELGQVRVVLVQRHDEMHVVISASEGARAALQQGSPELRRLLDAVGLPEARVTITDSGAGSATDQRGGQAGGDGLREQAEPWTSAPVPVASSGTAPLSTRAPVTAAVAAGVDLTI